MIKTIVSQVRTNCQVASSAQAGNLSLCGLLLRLRQLYKWEHGLAPWQEPDPEPVLVWIEQQESAWDALEGQSWSPLTLNGVSLDPLAVETVNQHLLPHGLAYGAGLSRGLAPTCFLGELAAEHHEDGLTIFILGTELARDLEAAPALCQGTRIYVRRQALAFYLWDHLADPAQQNNRFLRLALAARHLTLGELLCRPETHQDHFHLLLADFLDSAMHHEIGEARETSLRAAVPFILENFAQSRLEFWLRSFKDVLADVNEWGRLAFLIRERRLTALALMLAWQPGLYPLLLPELEPAFWDLVKSGDWEGFDRVRSSALDRLRRVALELTELVASAPGHSLHHIRQEIKHRFLTPLGL